MTADKPECGWPDDEAPFNWDDPALCRRPAVCIVQFKGAEKGIPSCQFHAEEMLRLAGPTAARVEL